MACEAKWYDSGAGYVVLVMDPACSGVTWAGVQAKIAGGEALPETVYTATWGYEEEGTDKTAYLEQCKTEATRLAELAFKPASTISVTLSD